MKFTGGCRALAVQHGGDIHNYRFLVSSKGKVKYQVGSKMWGFGVNESSSQRRLANSRESESRYSASQRGYLHQYWISYAFGDSNQTGKFVLFHRTWNPSLGVGSIGQRSKLKSGGKLVLNCGKPQNVSLGSCRNKVYSKPEKLNSNWSLAPAPLR